VVVDRDREREERRGRGNKTGCACVFLHWPVLPLVRTVYRVNTTVLVDSRFCALWDNYRLRGYMLIIDFTLL
jgi:hypothetical protein